VQAKIIIIHHFKHNFNTPVTPDGTDELWALLGNGVTSSSKSTCHLSKVSLP
jgi:hypothetical protein